MENFRAGAYAVTAMIMLVIVMYIAYIAIPLIILCSVGTLVFLLKSRPKSTSKPGPGEVVW